MKARLYCPTGKLRGTSILITREIVIGRAPAGPGVASAQIADDRVSSKHARIFWSESDACFYIEDLGSRNGTMVAGKLLRDRERLGPLDVVNFGGGGDFVFLTLDTRAASADTTRSGPPTDLARSRSLAMPTVPADATTIESEGPMAPPMRADIPDRTMIEPTPPPVPRIPTRGKDEETRID